MGWPKHDIEGWDKVCQDAVIRKINDALAVYSEKHDDEQVRDVIVAIQEAEGGNVIFDALLAWADAYIGDAEADYLSTHCIRTEGRRC